MRSVATNDCGHASPGLPSDSASVKGWGGEGVGWSQICRDCSWEVQMRKIGGTIKIRALCMK